jgi:Uma2 family endonuclease
MATTLSPVVSSSHFVLHVPDSLRMTDDQLLEFCAVNSELRIERTAEGDLIIMPPAGGETGRANIDISFQLRLWTKRDGTGYAFDSNTGFTLPNGAMRSPDASWILKTRWRKLPKEERQRFAHICPDFVIELKSPSDTISILRAKMEEWIANGVRLGWLINPDRQRVYVYRPNRAGEVLTNVTSVSADPELPGFTLDLTTIWDPDAE